MTKPVDSVDDKGSTIIWKSKNIFGQYQHDPWRLTSVSPNLEIILKWIQFPGSVSQIGDVTMRVSTV